MTSNETVEAVEGIAIIGMAGRFPGADTIQEFWQNLRNGIESISYFSDQELLEAGVKPGLLSDPHYVKARGILKNIDQFDASFFDYTPREAEILDPQQRIFLECAWEAFEHAGYDPVARGQRTAVFAGASLNTYLQANLYPNHHLLETVGLLQIANSNEKDFLTTRTSYKLNLRGPSVNVQTACSTSLVAIHLACQSLLNGESDMALAGGVSINVPPKSGYMYQTGGITSPDGHCRAFDASAQGIVIGDGVGIVILKRLGDALADGDTIHAVIKGSAINNDGALKIGYTAPGQAGQAEVIAEAQALAGTDPESITYIEAHGTGTALGDPIEIAALQEVFRSGTSKRQFCAIGSLKTNIGHLDITAGVAGLIKAVLALQHRELPASLHFQHPNPKIDFANSPFYVNTRLTDWKGSPLRVGVSSFGIGGTNAHVILEEAPLAQTTASTRPQQLLVLSAKTAGALEQRTAQLIEHLRHHPDLNIADLAYTLQIGRRSFPYRRTLVCQSSDDALQALVALHPTRVLTAMCKEKQPTTIFLFPGQGAQYVSMAAELYTCEPFFRELVDHSAILLSPYLELDLRTILYPQQEQGEAAAQRLMQTEMTQPALFVIEYALARLWMSWGVQPQAFLGHSVGEYVAACLAGVFTFEDALRLVALRGKLMQRLPEGAMLGVSLSEVELEPLLNKELSLAAINTPNSCVVSGPTYAIEECERQLARNAIPYRRLHTSHAFHSTMMSPIAETFAAQVQQVARRAPRIPYLSNVTGTWITSEQAQDPEYWARHLLQTVKFAAGISELWQMPNPLFLEVGPGRTLSTFVLEAPTSTPREQRPVLCSLPGAQEKQLPYAFLLTTLGRLWLAGVAIDWSQMHSNERRRRIPLPTYPFERRRFWIDPPMRKREAGMPVMSTPASANEDKSRLFLPSWKRSLPPGQGSVDVGHMSRVLLFADENGIAARVGQKLIDKGSSVVTVLPGSHFARTGEQGYTLNPQQSTDYNVLLSDLQTRHWSPSAIVHCWMLTPIASELQEPADLQDRGFYSLLFLIQALEKQARTTPGAIAIISNGMQMVTGEERLVPGKATVLGLCKVIPQEYPSITCRSIDMTLPGAGTWQEDVVVDQLLQELQVQQSEVTVAYRGRQRWIETVEPVHPDTSQLQRPRIRQGGVYLITGGLGMIGLTQATCLARHAQAKLVLVGRTPLPPEETWPQWLASHDRQDPFSRRIRGILTLKNLGAQVLLCTANVADQEQMQAALTQAYTTFGTLHGVIHSAGMISDEAFSMLHTADTAMCEQHFQAKMYGVHLLEELLQGYELDFCLLQSSLSTTLGGIGYGAYAAANSFMDAVAYQQNQKQRVPWISVNWDGWSAPDASKNVSNGEAYEQTRAGITPKEGEELFTRILSLGEIPRILVAKGDLAIRVKQWVNRDYLNAISPENNQEKILVAPLHPRSDLLENPVTAPRNDTEQVLAEIWQNALGLAQVGIYDDFFALGGHSVIALQVIAHIQKALHIEAGIHVLFEHPTIAELSEALLQQKRQPSQKSGITHVSRTAYRAEISADGSLSVSEAAKKQMELHTDR